jgi:hypothetical protein
MFSTLMQKGLGWRRGLLQFLLRRVASSLCFRLFTGDSHRKSGVFSFRSLLSPVDSSFPPEL